MDNMTKYQGWLKENDAELVALRGVSDHGWSKAWAVIQMQGIYVVEQLTGALDHVRLITMHRRIESAMNELNGRYEEDLGIQAAIDQAG